jgi:AraC-like DNA-binding protein
MALWLADDFMRIGNIYRQKPSLYFMPIFYSFSFGPLIYFYVRSLTNHNFSFKRLHLLHFVPVTLQALLYFSITFSNYEFKRWYWLNVHQPYTYRIEFDGTWVSLTIYLILSFRLMQKYQVWVADNFSETSKIRLSWLKAILGILLVLCVEWFIEILERDLRGIYFDYDYTVEILGIIALVLGIAGWRQSNLTEANYDSGELDAEKQLRANFTPDPELLKKLSDTITAEKLYLNPTLTLVEFSKALKMSPKIVSRHINSGFGQSFNDFVNAYRVEEVKLRLKSADLDRLTILGIAMECGFNSKTTFNRIFKEMTGMAPTEFIR